MFHLFSFVLNTSVELPHEIGVNAVKFRPKFSVSDDSQYVVTVGKDDKFKVWYLADSTSIYGKYFIKKLEEILNYIFIPLF